MDYFLFDFSGVQFHYTMSHNNKVNKKEDFIYSFLYLSESSRAIL